MSGWGGSVDKFLWEGSAGRAGSQGAAGGRKKRGKAAAAPAPARAGPGRRTISAPSSDQNPRGAHHVSPLRLQAPTLASPDASLSPQNGTRRGSQGKLKSAVHRPLKGEKKGQPALEPPNLLLSSRRSDDSDSDVGRSPSSSGRSSPLSNGSLQHQFHLASSAATPRTAMGVTWHKSKESVDPVLSMGLVPLKDWTDMYAATGGRGGGGGGGGGGAVGDGRPITDRLEAPFLKLNGEAAIPPDGEKGKGPARPKFARDVPTRHTTFRHKKAPASKKEPYPLYSSLHSQRR